MAIVPTAAQRLRLLSRISRRVGQSRLLDDVLGPILRDLGDLAGLQRVSLGLVDARSEEVQLEAAHGLTPGEVRRGRYRLGEGLIGRVVMPPESGEAPSPQVARSIRSHPHFLDRTGALDAGVDRGLVCVPICWQGEPIAVLSAYRRAMEVHALADDARLLEAVGGILTPAIVHRQRQQQQQRGERSVASPTGILGRSGVMQDVFSLMEQVADSPTTVLLTGESGTGKELVAAALHERSARRSGAFVAVNCAALPEGVIESELFGHERGAFTGAVHQRKGRFELANGGTLFLDEIGDLSAANQVKLLRVLQERRFERVGGNSKVQVDVRVITATSRDLEGMVAKEAFRADLYYRLAVFPIRLPPLRERTGDILLLADHFIERFNRSHGRDVQRISTGAIDMLTAYHWPGNVRELENCIERAVLLTRDGVVHGHHFPPSLQTADATDTRPSGSLQQRLDAVEEQIILDALKVNRGNRAAAARDLGMSERVMGLRVDKYGIDPKRFKRSTGPG